MSATMAGLTDVLWAPDGSTHLLLWVPGRWPHEGFPHPTQYIVTFCGRQMSGPTFSCGSRTAGHTKVSLLSVGTKWLATPSPMGADVWPHRGFPYPTKSIVQSVGAEWLAPPSPVGANGWPHGGSHPHQSIVLSTPTYLLCVRSDRRPKFSVPLGGGGRLVF